ncbi:MAG: S-layer homology domain-containing protein [Clostridiales bacterium]|nr:S-layer homology domain-containing protein [Clostridiales bacterium]
MKKLLSVLTASMLLSTTAFADAQSVLSQIKERVDTSLYTEFSSGQYTNDERTVYSFDWSNDSEDLFIEAYEDGTITRFNLNDKNYEKSQENLFSFARQRELTQSAYEVADKLNPQFAGTYKLEPHPFYSLYANGYTFNIVQYYKDIPVDASYSTMRLDDDKNTESYYYDPIDTALFEEGDIMPKASAKRIFDEKQGLELQYATYYDCATKNRTARLVYRIKNRDKGIDGITGDLRSSPSSIRYALSEDAAAGGANAAAKAEAFTEAETTGLSELAGLYSSEELINIAKNNAVLGLSEYTEQRCNIKKDPYEGTYSADIYLNGENNKAANVTLDAATGEVLSFWRNAEDTSAETVIENPEETAAAYISQLAGDSINEYILKETDNIDSRYYQSYVRLVNGLPYYDNAINIIIDPTGELLGYSKTYFKNISFPLPNGIITKEAAQEKLFSGNDFSVKWHICEYDDSGNVREVSPLYSFDNPYITIDALSGEPDVEIYTNGATEEPRYKDIETCAYRDEIRALADMGIGYSNELLEPDKEITQDEFFTLARNAVTLRQPVIIDPEAEYDMQYFINEGFTSDPNGSSAISRSAACMAMSKILGIDKVTAFNEIFISPYTDVTENAGAIAAMNAIGILKCRNDGYFHPDASLSRAEALSMIYRCIVNNE